MDLALAVLLLWGLLFVPIGFVLHWLVLGEGSSARALPLAPVTGIASAVLVLAALGRLGVDAGTTWVPWTFVALSAGCVIVIWRCSVPWRSRELVGAGCLLLLAVLLVQMPVIGDEGDGPLGYGTTANPVSEVAAIDSAAGGPTSRLEVARVARASRDDRAIGFEQFAALTVGIGRSSDDTGSSPSDAAWTAYGLHAPISGMLAALIALPLFAFARARGVRWFGLLVLVPLGVTAPAVFVALANGEGAAIASVPLSTAAVFCLLVTRRDRGWWAMVMLFGAAVAAVAGPTALLPLLAVGISWMLLRSNTYEHLSQHDAPVRGMRSLVAAALAAGLGIVACLPLVAGGGQQLAWTPLHERLLDAVRSWPFQWLASDLSVAGPSTPLETAIWLIGPALLAVAVIYAIVRNERRELGVLVGAIVAVLVAVGIGLADADAGIRLYEFTILSLSPFLAALAIRAVALARENAESADEGRLAGTGPTLLVVVFVLLSFAATSVTGSRMAHAPSRSAAAFTGDSGREGATTDGRASALIAAGDPWLAFVIDGERVRGEYADADAVSEDGNRWSDHGTRVTGYGQVVVSSSPLASDPGMRYVEQSGLDEYQVRQFVDALGNEDTTIDLRVDEPRVVQRSNSQAADRDASGGRSDASSSAAVSSAAGVSVAMRHDPLEGSNVNVRPDRPAGLLVPAADVPGCSSDRSLVTSDESTCEPDAPVVGSGCTDDEVQAARASDDRERSRALRRDAASTQVVSVDDDKQLPNRPSMTGVQCFDVPLDEDSSILLLHLRDVGLVLPPEDAGTRGRWDRERLPESRGTGGVDGGVRIASDRRDAQLSFGTGRLAGLSYDLVLEGEFGSGVELSTGLSVTEDSTGRPDVIPSTSLGTVRAAADGFSSILRAVPLAGVVTVANTSGTDVSIGRLFARPRDLPRSCNVPIALAAHQQREVRIDALAANGIEKLERPGLAVTVLGIEGGDEGERTARVAVASYLTRAGLARYTLVDWTEQYESPIDVEGCDGVVHTETGEPRRVRQALVTSEGLRSLASAITGATETER